MSAALGLWDHHNGEPDEFCGVLCPYLSTDVYAAVRAGGPDAAQRIECIELAPQYAHRVADDIGRHGYCFDDLIGRFADRVGLAFNTNTAVVIDPLGIVVVPDVVLMQVAANGHETPATWSVVRADGRTAALYRVAGVPT